jgi:predicted lipoprotein with Yx(FWY)xxD motif
MTRSRPITFLADAAAIALTALAAVGCGGGGATAASGHPATIGTANEGNLGTILADSKGRTLYLFQKDSGTKSSCFGACASAWPPLRANGKSTVGSGAIASKAGTTTRSDGKQPVTYNGHPLDLFAGDEKAGRHRGPRRHGVRRRLVRAHPSRKPSPRPGVELGRRIELGRRQCLLAQAAVSPRRSGCPQSNSRSV